MTITDVENYENALEELNNLYTEEVLDYEKIHRLEEIVAEYENMMYA